MYKVYAKLDLEKHIVSIESTAFYTEQDLINEGFILLDEGEDGYIYGHAQPNYLKQKYGKCIIDEQTRYNFKYVDEAIVELTEAEKQALNTSSNLQPTEQERINAQLMREIASLKLSIGGGQNV